MCGVLLIQGAVSPERQQAALSRLRQRGPDFEVVHQTGSCLLAQSVLHITGTRDFYHQQHDDAFVYNGEIYNWRDFGDTANDTETAWMAARQDPGMFAKFHGPWAWARATQDHVWYATDPQGERYLYRYHTRDLTVVASEAAVVQDIVASLHQDCEYNNKCWTLQDQTPWRDIHRLEPGRLYCDHEPQQSLDTVWNWISPVDCTAQEAQQEFQRLWHQVISNMTPTCDFAISYSGGVDSSLILSQLPNAELVTVNMLGKDPIVDRVTEFLASAQLQNLNQIDVEVEQYAVEYRDLIERTQMPAQSWSFVGKWLVAKHTQSRVLFTGLAADELFGGYGIYQQLEYSTQGSTSPYSSDDHAGLWDQCLSVYRGDPRPATLLMDYWYQVVGCDAPGQDRIAGAWGRETRNPFMHQSIMRFALNLPWHLRVNTTCKPVLINEFLQHWPRELLLPKQGFAGHANDSLPWMAVDVANTGDRYRDWKQIAKTTYYNYTQTPTALAPLDN